MNEVERVAAEMRTTAAEHDGAENESLEDWADRLDAPADREREAKELDTDDCERLTTDILVALEPHLYLPEGPDVDDARDAVMRELVSFVRSSPPGVELDEEEAFQVGLALRRAYAAEHRPENLLTIQRALAKLQRSSQ